MSAEIEVGRKQVNIEKQAQIDAAYCAGIFDAEGTFVLRASKVAFGLPVVCVYNGDLELLSNVAAIVGGSIREVKRKKRSDEHSIEYVLDLGNKEAVAKAIAIIQPFLVLKKKQSEIVLASLRSAPSGRVAFVDQIHELNRKAQQFKVFKSRTRADLSLPCEVDWAYLAGWVTGDGTFMLQPQHWQGNSYWYPWVIVYSTRPEPLTHLQSKFGGKVSFREKKSGWAAEGSIMWQDQKEVKDLLTGLLPYMRTRKNEAEILLESCSYPADERQTFREMLDNLGRA